MSAGDTSATARYVTFKGGFVAWLPVVHRLIDLEIRGFSFEVIGGGFRVWPSELLTPDDDEFLSTYREEARRVLEYQADDSHLYADIRGAGDGRQPAE